MCAVLFSGDFQVTFNPDDDRDNDHSVFFLLEQACFELANMSYNIHYAGKDGIRKLVNGRESLYENFLYSRMLWSKWVTGLDVMNALQFISVSIAMKFHEARKVCLNTHTKQKWGEMFLEYRDCIIFEMETCIELSNGLEVGHLLKLPSDLTFNYKHLSSLLITETSGRAFYELR